MTWLDDPSKVRLILNGKRIRGLLALGTKGRYVIDTKDLDSYNVFLDATLILNRGTITAAKKAVDEYDQGFSNS